MARFGSADTDNGGAPGATCRHARRYRRSGGANECFDIEDDVDAAEPTCIVRSALRVGASAPRALRSPRGLRGSVGSVAWNCRDRSERGRSADRLRVSEHASAPVVPRSCDCAPRRPAPTTHAGHGRPSYRDIVTHDP